MDRCRTRCEQGIRFVEDVNENEPGWNELGMGLDEGKSPARSGLAHELIGDFRVYADLGGHEEEYATARRYTRSTHTRRRKSPGRPSRSSRRP